MSGTTITELILNISLSSPKPHIEYQKLLPFISTSMSLILFITHNNNLEYLRVHGYDFALKTVPTRRRRFVFLLSYARHTALLPLPTGISGRGNRTCAFSVTGTIPLVAGNYSQIRLTAIASQRQKRRKNDYR